MPLQLSSFTESVQALISELESRPFPLTQVPEFEVPCELERLPARDLFPLARRPEEALSGLFLRSNCWDKSHGLSQELTTVEGSYWHGIAHRLEPDYANAEYWFRRVGQHAIFPQLHRRAVEILADHRIPWRLKESWDPFLFINWCEEAVRGGNRDKEAAALAIQKAEWELLFEWCGARI
jgi:hypothetical protein